MCLLPTMNSIKLKARSLQSINSTMEKSSIMLADLKACRFWRW
ncbi:unnamed protein product [Brassica oleracea]